MKIAVQTFVPQFVRLNWFLPLPIIAVLLLPTNGAAESSSIEQLRVQRKQAAQRTRRVIFNNDGCEPLGDCKANTAEELLRHRTTPLAGTSVDSLFYCTTTGSFGQFIHNTKIGSIFTSKEERYGNNRVGELLAAGVDPLQVMVAFGQQKGMEVFCSFRMNDTHDAGSRWGPMLTSNPLKQQHPEWLIGTLEHKPKYGRWSAADYTRPEIRDLQFRYVEEVCQNYDVDGIELDFFRHPVFFKRGAQDGTPCNAEEMALMTDLIRRIRTMTEVEGQRRGRPILIAARVPDSVEYSRDVGLDLETWLEDDLIDLLVVSGYYQLNEWETSVALGKQHGVPVYPSLDESRIKDDAAVKLRSSASAYRGRALVALQDGTSGIYVFNLFGVFKPNSPVWQELGSRELLERADQDYFASILGVGATPGTALPHKEYQRVATLNPTTALPVQAGTPAAVDFRFAGNLNLRAGEPTPQLKLRLQFDDADVERLRVRLNGEPLPASEVNGNWLEFPLQPAQLRQGTNQVEVALGDDGKQIKWTDLHCTVRWPRQSTTR